MNRLMQLLLATASLVVIGLGGVVLAQTLPGMVAPQPMGVASPDAAPPAPPETLHLTGPEMVGDGPMVRIRLIAQSGYGTGSFSSAPGSDVVNIGFLAPGAPVRWMFGARGPLIVDALPLTLMGDLIAPVAQGQDIFNTAFDAATPTSRAPDAPHEVALMLLLVETDQNGDGRLTVEDGMTLALTQPDGTGRVDLATGLVDRPQLLPADRDLAFLIQTAAGYEALRVDPVAFTVTDRQPVPLP